VIRRYYYTAGFWYILPAAGIIIKEQFAKNKKKFVLISVLFIFLGIVLG